MKTSRSLDSRLRCTAVAVTESAIAVVLMRALLQLASPLATVEDAVANLCVFALVGCVAWGWLAATSVVLEAWGGAVALRLPGVPGGVRRLLLAACGAVVASALAQPASALGDDSGRGPLEGLPLPERAVGVSAPGPPVRAVVVRPGDCLWSLAAADLGPRASVAAVEARWRWIYHLNRAVVGPDPDLIRAGQLLELPPRP